MGNPGTLPQMRHLACGLDSAGLLASYVSPFDFPVGCEPSVLRFVPSRLARPLRDQLRRRELNPAIDEDRVGHASSGLEAMAVTLQRLGSPWMFRRSLRVRNAAFDRALSRRVKPGMAAVVAATGAASRAFQAAHQCGTMTVLDYPIAHHRFAESILAEEARLQPDYAATLQYHRFSPRRRAQLEAEIEAADRVLVLSRFQERTFIDSGVDGAKLLVTPLGVDTELFSPDTAAVEMPPDRFRVIFVGQIGQRKGISYLIEAFSRAAIPGSELVLVGAVVGTSAPWSGTPGVKHIPHVPRWELPDLYRRAHVFAFPSLVEGFGLTPLEAMACGLPAIVSTNTFADDVIEDGRDGWVVPIRDAATIAERLRFLAENPSERASMGACARRKAEMFTWNRYRDQTPRAIAEAAGIAT